MTIGEAVDRIDSLKHNIFTVSEKIAWLSRLDGLVKQEILDTCEGEEVPFAGYGAQTDRNTTLLVGAPHDELYLRYLEAQMDYANGEIDRYNNAIAMFQASFDRFSNHYRRSHMPKKTAFRYF